MDLEKEAIERIKMASEMSLGYYKKPLICTYSGGKDSDVMLELFRRSGIPFEVHHSHTTADAPQTVYHIREVFKELELQGIKCNIDYHCLPGGGRITMWNLIPKKLMPPTRLVRYCCSVLKETGCENRYIATGVRWEESRKRKNRQEFEKFGNTIKDKEMFTKTILINDNIAERRMSELCMQQHKMVVNPIIDWKNRDIWDFINSERIETCELYKCGYERVGCVGCPVAGKKRHKEFADFPKYKSMYICTFEKMLNERRKKGKECKWKSGEEVFLWWMEDENIPGQMSIEDFI